MSLIGQQVFVTPGQVFDGIGSGGGGGGGANPVVSTITINPAGAVNLQNDGSGGSADILGFTNNSASATSTTTFSVAFPSGYVGVNGLSGIWTVESQDNFNLNYYGDICAGKFVVAGNNAGTNAELPWITAGVACDMTIHAASSINLQTSSVLVNGTPLSGGGVAPGANLTGLSTISVSSMTVTNGLLLTEGLAMSNTTIGFDTLGQAIQYFNAGNSNLYITGVSTASVKIGTQSNTNVVSVEDNSAVIPNITGVSTLNGVQPTGKASYQVSTLTAGVTYLPQGNVAWPLSGDIPVTAGHVYRISGNLALSNAGGSGHTTLAVSGGGAGFPQFIHSYPNSLASPGNNGLAGGVAGIVTPSASPLQIVGYNTDLTTSTALEFYYLNWLVEDLGTNL